MTTARSRRSALQLLGAALLPAAGAAAEAATDTPSAGPLPAPAELARFLAEARRMKSAAVAAGDQPYGAVLVQSGEIRGWGPSRVVLERDENAHAERVAIREAQKSLGRSDLSGSILVSTSRPCAACEAAAAAAGVSRMIFGDGVDGGRPRRRTG